MSSSIYGPWNWMQYSKESLTHVEQSGSGRSTSNNAAQHHISVFCSYITRLAQVQLNPFHIHSSQTRSLASNFLHLHPGFFYFSPSNLILLLQALSRYRSNLVTHGFFIHKFDSTQKANANEKKCADPWRGKNRSQVKLYF